MAAQHEIERSQNLMLLLDCGRLMTARLDGRRKLDYAVTAALSLATLYQSTARPAAARDILTPALDGLAPMRALPEVARAQALLQALSSELAAGLGG